MVKLVVTGTAQAPPVKIVAVYTPGFIPPVPLVCVLLTTPFGKGDQLIV
jgi:hypothetical protein